jgi:AraC-like DNA-binding protein
MPEFYKKVKAKPRPKQVSHRAETKLPRFYPDIQARFKYTFTESELTLAEFAEKLGMTESHVKQIIYSSTTPSIFVIRNWHRAFKKSYDWILDGVER